MICSATGPYVHNAPMLRSVTGLCLSTVLAHCTEASIQCGVTPPPSLNGLRARSPDSSRYFRTYQPQSYRCLIHRHRIHGNSNSAYWPFVISTADVVPHGYAYDHSIWFTSKPHYSLTGHLAPTCPRSALAAADAPTQREPRVHADALHSPTMPLRYHN